MHKGVMTLWAFTWLVSVATVHPAQKFFHFRTVSDNSCGSISEGIKKCSMLLSNIALCTTVGQPWIWSFCKNEISVAKEDPSHSKPEEERWRLACFEDVWFIGIHMVHLIHSFDSLKALEFKFLVWYNTARSSTYRMINRIPEKQQATFTVIAKDKKNWYRLPTDCDFTTHGNCLVFTIPSLLVITLTGKT